MTKDDTDNSQQVLPVKLEHILPVKLEHDDNIGSEMQMTHSTPSSHFHALNDSHLVATNDYSTWLNIHPGNAQMEGRGEIRVSFLMETGHHCYVSWSAARSAPTTLLNLVSLQQGAHLFGDVSSRLLFDPCASKFPREIVVSVCVSPCSFKEVARTMRLQPTGY